MKGSNTQECRQMTIRESCEHSFILFAINSKLHLRTQTEEGILLNPFGNIMLGGVLLPCSWTPAPDWLQEKQHSILQSHTPETLHLCEKGFTLQQDNEPKHTSKLCRNYLKTKEGLLTVTDFPPHWAFMGHLKSEKAKHSWRKKNLFGTLSDHAGITRVISFNTVLLSLCSLYIYAVVQEEKRGILNRKRFENVYTFLTPIWNVLLVATCISSKDPF